jgi:2,3-diketo-5-methylthio-1-phosphopentane phosphatase
VHKRWYVFIDFDGTLTTRDADFTLADLVLGERGVDAYKDNAAAYERLELSLRQYFEHYLSLMNVPPQRFVELCQSIELRSDAESFVSWCRRQALEVRVVSEGLDIYIHPLLKRLGLTAKDVTCNRAIYDGATYSVVPALEAHSCARCLTCKGVLVKAAQERGFATVIVGNGASDLCGAKHAQLVFARDSLVSHCDDAGIAFYAWENFADVRRVLEQHIF